MDEFVRRAQEANPDLIAAVGECNAGTGAGDPYLPFRQVLTVLTGADDPKGTASTVNATSTATRSKEFVRVSGETLLAVGPDLIGIFVPGAAILAKIATTAAKQSKLADKLAERVKAAGAGAIDSSLDQERYLRAIRAECWPRSVSSGRSSYSTTCTGRQRLAESAVPSRRANYRTAAC